MKKLQIAKHRCLTTIFNQHSRSLQSAQFQGGHHSVTNSVSDPNVQYGHVCVCVWILKLRTKTFFLGHSDLWPSLTPSGHLCHIWRHALKVFLRYRGQENGKKRTNPRTQWSQLLLVLRNKYLKQDNVAGSEMIYQFIYQLPVFLPSSVLGLLPVSSYQPAGSHFFQTAQTKIDVVGWCLTGAS